jgi:tetratricopeptide (TPR) repeat protein
VYRHYESSEDVFVDREENIEWMNKALEECKRESVVLHLKGIGGIGKSSLLNHWINTYDKTIRLDCYQYSDFFQRLNILAKGAVLKGVKLQRFDILWQIRQRFVEGVEPIREEGRAWAKEVIMAIPFIGSLASIGSAISAVSSRVTPKLKGKYGTVGKWLQEQLGTNHVEVLLEILWKEPRRAEFLYLSAFLEDLNNREDFGIPLLILLDHFEHVDDDNAMWKYKKRKINESELWTVFLSNLSNCVGVLASRKSAAKVKHIEVEETELLELDRDSCFEMLEFHDVTDKELQERIVSVSGGNPFVIDAICDMISTSDVSTSDIESFRADNLAEVRLKVWRRLFSQAKGMHSFINRAGIVPYFDERIMRIAAPEITPDNWDRLKRMSFVQEREDNTLVLHELAQDLVKAELREKLKSVALEVGSLLEEAGNVESDNELLGLAMSVYAFADEIETEIKIDNTVNTLLFQLDYSGTMEFLGAIDTNSAIILITKASWIGYVYFNVFRFAEAEEEIQKALDMAEEFAKQGPPENALHLGMAHWFHARLRQDARKLYESEESFQKVLEILDNLDLRDDKRLYLREHWIASTYHDLGILLSSMYRLREAEDSIRNALVLYERLSENTHYTPSTRERKSFIYYSQNYLAEILNMSGKNLEAEKILRVILDICEEKTIEWMTLGGLASTLKFQHRYVEELEVVRRDFQLMEGLASKDPGYETRVLVHLPPLLVSYMRNGQYKKAERIFNKYIPECKKLHEEMNSHSELLSSALRDVAVLLALSDRLQEAETTTLETLSIFQDLAKKYPEGYTHRLATTLNNLGIFHSLMGRNRKSLQSLQEAYDIAKDISLKYPEAVSLAEVYGIVASNLGAFYMRNNKLEAAENVLKEAGIILNKRAASSPEMFLPHVAAVLINTGVLLCKTNRMSEAESKFEEALQIRRDYVEKADTFFLPRVASVLNNLGVYYRRAHRIKTAEKAYTEAVNIMKSYAEYEPRVHRSQLVLILNNLRILYSEIEDSSGVDRIEAQLRELGIKKPASGEMWSESMEYLQGY